MTARYSAVTAVSPYGADTLPTNHDSVSSPEMRDTKRSSRSFVFFLFVLLFFLFFCLAFFDNWFYFFLFDEGAIPIISRYFATVRLATIISLVLKSSEIF